MAVEMAIWRMADTGPQPLASSPLDSERRLEDMLAQDPSMCGTELLILGRQVHTDHGGYIDLLAIDTDGRVHVLELKRDRTPRDVVAQALDYGSWAAGLGIEEIERIYRDHNGGDRQLDTAFAEQFGTSLPDFVNEEQQFTIVASELDPTSDRIVEFLAESYGVPINALFFRHFSDDSREYLARSWLLDPQQTETRASRFLGSKRRQWNGGDHYAVLGSKNDNQRWVVAHKYGFVNAGGGKWYWETLKHLKESHRVFAHVADAGYVGIGIVRDEMIRARDAKVQIGGELQPLIEQMEPNSPFVNGALLDDDDLTEWVVPVEWIGGLRPIEDAFWKKGLFANRRVCKLRDEHTIATVEAEFGIDEASGQGQLSN